MKSQLYILTLGLLILVQACTGQQPVALKNSTTPKNFVKASCSSMIFEGQILSKKNILNIFDCSGWARQFPDLNTAIKEADQAAVDKVFKPLNDQFFSTQTSRKNLYELVAQAESQGQIETLAKILQRSLSEHKVLAQLDKALNSEQLNLTQRSDLMKVLSHSNAKNLELISSLKNVILAYEQNKSFINILFTDEDKKKLIPRVTSLLNDFSKNMDSQSWNHLAGVLYDGDSPIKDWAEDGLNGDIRILLDVIGSPTFFKDTTYLKNSLTSGVNCINRASKREFHINIAQELKHKIESLKADDKDSFEKLLLHGLTKFLAFQEFCEEKNAKQGINAFYMVLKHAFSVLPSTHDFKFLKRIHHVFGDDRYVFLSFLSSESFSSLRSTLKDLKEGERDAELVKTLYSVLTEISTDDLKVASELLREVSETSSQAQSWHQSWSGIWSGLSNTEKENFVRLIGLFLQDDIQASDALTLLETLLVSFPDLSPAMAIALQDNAYQDSLRYVTTTLAQPEVQGDLSNFLSGRGLFELIEILTREYKAEPKPEREFQREERKPVTYVQTLQSSESLRTRSCFELLTRTYEENSSYYNLVNTLPEECLNVLGDAGFVGRIYLWMNSSQNYFKENFQIDDFHTASGVWAPGMLQFIFSSAVKADFAVMSAKGGKGILANIDEIHGNLTDPRLMESLHQLSLLYGTVNQEISLDNRLLNFFKFTPDSKMNELTRDTFVLLEEKKSVINYEISPTTCKDLSSGLGADPCLTEKAVIDGVTDILRILKRKNENGSSLVKNLLGWIHPEGGVEIPFKRAKIKNHKTSINEVIHFLYDLSDKKTEKNFVFHSPASTQKVAGTVIDRLEVVIRDIGFLNNFYGAFFKNEIAGSIDYRSNVIKSELLLVMLERSGGLFRGFGGLPKESRHKLKNIRATYSSMIELSDSYPQPDGSDRSYGQFIQGLLTTIADSSKLSTQKFNAYRIPNNRIPEGHNGVFLTKTVELSGLRHLSQFVRARLDDKLSALDSESFKLIDSNLIARHDLSKLQDETQNLLDKYLDNDQNQINLMLEESIKFLNSLKDPEDKKVLEEIVIKSVILLSKKEITNQNIQKLASVVEIVIQMWPEISKILSRVENTKNLLKITNQLLDGMISNPEELNRIVTTLLETDLLNVNEIRQLLRNEAFRDQASALINQFSSLQNFETQINWLETIKAVFSSDMQWESIKTWLDSALGGEPKKLTLSVLLQVLGEKSDGNYRMKMLMDELFINHRPQLEQFLSETFKSLELKPE